MARKVVERIEPLLEVAMERATNCFIHGLLPEVLGKWHSGLPQYAHPHQQENLENQPEPLTEKWCFCSQGESGEMIQCDKEQCKIKWLHTECLRISKVPRGKCSALSVTKEREGRKRKPKSHYCVRSSSSSSTSITQKPKETKP